MTVVKVDADPSDDTTVVVDIGPALVLPGHDVPAGGTTAQVMVKASDDDYDLGWFDQTAQYMPAGGTDAQVLAKASDTDFDLEWVDQSGGGGGGAVDSVNGETGTVVLAAADVGAQDIAEKDQANGYPGLNGSGQIDDSQLSDAIERHDAIVSYVDAGIAAEVSDRDDAIAVGVAAAEAASDPAGSAGDAVAAHVALSDPHPQYLKEAGLGDIVIRNASEFDAAGAAAAVTKTSLGLGSVDNTSDAGKPVSTAQQTALNLKAPVASPTFTGTVTIPTGASITAPTGLAKGDVGLGSVDNTADTAKPVSTAQQTALNLKANLASPTFTGTVAGVSASMVGLGNVTNDAQVKVTDIGTTVARPTDVQVFTTPGGTWTKPAGAKRVLVELIGGGAGGGSGRLGAAGSNRCGGSGGGAGGRTTTWFDPSILGTTETVTVGGTAAGGAAKSGSAADGSAGGAGNPTAFGAWITAAGGGFLIGGAGGTATDQTTGGTGGLLTDFPAVYNSAQNALTAATGGFSTGAAAGTAGLRGQVGSGPGGGGGGGGLPIANTERAGGAGGGGEPGGATGGSAGAVHANGGAATATTCEGGGAGGGGGGSSASTSVNAGSGSAGASYGAGGGGGGAGTQGGAGTSGAGGAGAAGYAKVTTFF